MWFLAVLAGNAVSCLFCYKYFDFLNSNATKSIYSCISVKSEGAKDQIIVDKYWFIHYWTCMSISFWHDENSLLSSMSRWDYTYPSLTPSRLYRIWLHQESLSAKMIDLFTASKVVVSCVIWIFALRDP